MGNLGSEGSYGDFTGNLGKRHEKFDLWFRGCAVWNLLGVHPPWRPAAASILEKFFIIIIIAIDEVGFSPSPTWVSAKAALIGVARLYF